MLYNLFVIMEIQPHQVITLLTLPKALSGIVWMMRRSVGIHL